MLSEEGGRQRDKRYEEQEQQVHPHQGKRGAAYDSKQLVMIDPQGADDEEAQRVDRELRRQRRQETGPHITFGRALRQLQLKHHNGDDDGDDAVTERSNTFSARIYGDSV